LDSHSDSKHVGLAGALLNDDTPERLALAELPIRAAWTVLVRPRRGPSLIVGDIVDDRMLEFRCPESFETWIGSILDDCSGSFTIAPRVIVRHARRSLNDGWIERTGDDLVHSWPPRRQRLAWRRPVRRRARSHQTDSYHRTRNEYELRAHRCRDPSVEVSN